jgi:hypothetical protein
MDEVSIQDAKSLSDQLANEDKMAKFSTWMPVSRAGSKGVSVGRFCLQSAVTTLHAHLPLQLFFLDRCCPHNRLIDMPPPPIGVPGIAGNHLSQIRKSANDTASSSKRTRDGAITRCTEEHALGFDIDVEPTLASCYDVVAS